MSNSLAIDYENKAEPYINPLKAKETAANLKRLKIGIWVYFFLWIIEGALRKWVLPSLSTPLLIVRDPVAIYLLVIAWKCKMFPQNKYVIVLFVITIISIPTAVLLGHGSLLIALYGARIFLIHFPLVFVIGEAFDRNDVIKMGKVVLWIAIPMAVLIYFQFNSPQTARINRGVGEATEGAGLQGALGYFRPPGTFSFTSGNVQFFTLVGAFVIYFLLNQKEVKRYLLIVSTCSLLAAVPLSISRTLVFQLCISTFFAITPVLRRPKLVGRIIVAAMGSIILVLLLSNLGLFETPMKALTTRFANADASEGGIGNTAKRLFADIDVPLLSPDFPFFGYGLGMGTNVGAKLLVGNADTFLIAEGEWGRLIGEMGIVMGGLAILARIGISLELLSAAFKNLRNNDLLAWLLISISCQAFAQAQWGQPSSLGFSILATGLTIAALNFPESTAVEAETVMDNNAEEDKLSVRYDDVV